MANFFPPHIIIFLLSFASVAVYSLNILQIAPNLVDSNYQLSLRFANILTTNGHYVHFLVPMRTSRCLYSGDLLNKKVQAQSCLLPQQTKEMVDEKARTDSETIEPTPIDTETTTTQPEGKCNEPSLKQGEEKTRSDSVSIGHRSEDIWSSHNYKQSPATAYVEGFEVIADIYRQKNCWAELEKAHKEKDFKVGLMDVWDFGALALFHKLGIKDIVLIQNFPLMSHMYDIMSEAKWPTENDEKMDYKKQILENGVPELFSTVINDKKIGQNGAFREEHRISSDNFTKIYEKADNKIQKIFNDEKLLTLKKMLGNAKFLFLNTMPSLDYQLGKLPKQVKFIGGIDLLRPAFNQMPLKEQKRIIISNSTLLEPSAMPEGKFETLVKALGQLTEIEIVWKYDRFKFAKHEKRQPFLEKHAPNVKLCDICSSHIIGYENTVLVISECDIRTVMDVLSLEKPLFCMPLYAEQFYVAEVLRREGAAIVLDPRDDDTFTSEAIVKHIREHIPSLFSSQEKNPLERKVFQFPSKETLEQSVLDAFATFETSDATDPAEEAFVDKEADSNDEEVNAESAKVQTDTDAAEAQSDAGHV